MDMAVGRWMTMILAGGAIASMPVPAMAGLGAPLASVAVDGARMTARMRTTAADRFNRHELTRPNGGQVREFTNADGTVFAVAWAGPGQPDLRAVLGRYFRAFQTSGASIGRTMHALRRPAQVDQPDLQIQTAGHMGWFRGFAFVPSLAPSGVTVADLATPAP